MMTLAETSIAGMEPKTWVTIGSALFSVVAASVGWCLAHREKKKAKESAEVAKGQAEYANRARMEVAQKLDEANKIAANAHALQAEYVELERSKREREPAFEAAIIPDNSNSLFVLTIRNLSPEKNLSLRSLRLSRDGDFVNARHVNYGARTGNHGDIEAGAVAEVSISAYTAASFGSKASDDIVPLNENAKLFVEFSHDPNSIPLAGEEWQQFVRLSAALSRWMIARPPNFNGEGKGWDVRAFRA